MDKLIDFTMTNLKTISLHSQDIFINTLEQKYPF